MPSLCPVEMLSSQHLEPHRDSSRSQKIDSDSLSVPLPPLLFLLLLHREKP
uniref:DNAJ heat shock N-terminal domain-containing family protein n=1 Tax=Rhizophora mucronata TaxID=61149 RepID=A0A2P2NKK4_RHIMU